MSAYLCNSIDVSAAGIVDRPQARAQFSDGYDATEPKGRRKAPPARIVREDVHLKGAKRTQLQAGAADIARNFSIAAWAIRRHLDYVSLFDFRCQSKDTGLNKEVELLLAEISTPELIDRGRRCNREKLFRLTEARRVIDGDVALLKMRSGQVQGIEACLIKDPDKPDANAARDSGSEWVDGIEIDYAGAPKNFALHGREKGGIGTKFRRTVSATNILHYGFFDHFASEQTRGVSPIAAALNPLRDVYEVLDYAVIKAKISQLFAYALTRGAEEPGLDKILPQADSGDGEACEDDCDTTEPRTFDLSKGPVVWDLLDGEKMDALESKNPSTELQQFMRLVIAVALKALDLPYSFYDEGYTNYSGTRGGWIHYERACIDKREDQIQLRKYWWEWRLRQLIVDGRLKLPRTFTINDVRGEWIPRGMPWWKPSEEITGDLKAIGGGLSNPFLVTAQRGMPDPLENIDRTLDVLEYAMKEGNRRIGAPLALNFDGAFLPEVPEPPATT